MNSDLFGKIFEKHSEVEAVFLFGSATTDKTHAESDLDLAILANDSSILKKRLDLLEALAREGFCHIDLVFIEDGDIVLQYEAVKNLRIIYKRDTFDLGTFFSRIVRQYFDFYPYLKVQREAYKERVLNGTG